MPAFASLPAQSMADLMTFLAKPTRLRLVPPLGSDAGSGAAAIRAGLSGGGPGPSVAL